MNENTIVDFIPITDGSKCEFHVTPIFEANKLISVEIKIPQKNRLGHNVSTHLYEVVNDNADGVCFGHVIIEDELKFPTVWKTYQNGEASEGMNGKTTYRLYPPVGVNAFSFSEHVDTVWFEWKAAEKDEASSESNLTSDATKKSVMSMIGYIVKYIGGTMIFLSIIDFLWNYLVLNGYIEQQWIYWVGYVVIQFMPLIVLPFVYFLWKRNTENAVEIYPESLFRVWRQGVMEGKNRKK